VAVPEDEDVDVREAGGAPGLAPLGLPRLVDDGEAEALDLRRRHLRQPLAERPVVVVPADRQQPPRAGLELVQQGDVHPVTGVHHDVRGVDRGPQSMR
jgi:hypothetical protein